MRPRALAATASHLRSFAALCAALLALAAAPSAGATPLSGVDRARLERIVRDQVDASGLGPGPALDPTRRRVLLLVSLTELDLGRTAACREALVGYTHDQHRAGEVLTACQSRCAAGFDAASGQGLVAGLRRVTTECPGGTVFTAPIDATAVRQYDVLDQFVVVREELEQLEAAVNADGSPEVRALWSQLHDTLVRTYAPPGANAFGGYRWLRDDQIAAVNHALDNLSAAVAGARGGRVDWTRAVRGLVADLVAVDLGQPARCRHALAAASAAQSNARAAYVSDALQACSMPALMTELPRRASPAVRLRTLERVLANDWPFTGVFNPVPPETVSSRVSAADFMLLRELFTEVGAAAAGWGTGSEPPGILAEDHVWDGVALRVRAVFVGGAGVGAPLQKP